MTQMKTSSASVTKSHSKSANEINFVEGLLLNGLGRAALPLQLIGKYQSNISSCNAYIQCAAGDQMLLQPSHQTKEDSLTTVKTANVKANKEMSRYN